MSNASFKTKSNPKSAAPVAEQLELPEQPVVQPHAGIYALVEFLLLGTLVALSPHLTGSRVAVHSSEAVLLGLMVMHSVIVFKRRIWDPWFSLLAVLLVYFLGQAVAGLLVYVVPFARGWSESRATFWINNSVSAQFFYFFLATGLSLSAIYGYLRFFKISLPTIGLRRPRWNDLWYGLAAVPFYYVLYLISVGLIGHFIPSLNVNQKQQLGFDNVHGAVQMILTFASLVVLPPILEEIMIRGLLYSSLKKAMPMVAAVVVTSAIFASAHLPEGGATGPLYIAAIDTFILSLFLIYLREKTSGLWASMTLHAVKNGIAFAALFVLHMH